MRVRFTAEAQADLEVIYNHITEQNASAAWRLKARLKGRAEGLGSFPYRGQVTDRPGIRVLVDGRYPYLIFYTVVDNEVVILHVRHASRERP